MAGDLSTVRKVGSAAHTSQCGASFEVTADPTEVVAHYQRELEADGWTVSVRRRPGQVEGGGRMIAMDVHATRGAETFDIAIESYNGMTNAALYVNA